MNLQQIFRPGFAEDKVYPSASRDDGALMRLNCNENPWPPFADDQLQLNRYPDKQPAELINRLAEVYGADPQQLIITRGADDGIDILIRGFCRPGQDSIIQCPPTFVMYACFAKLHGAGVIDVPLCAEQGFGLDVEQLLSHERSRRDSPSPAKILFLCSPNNPTGNLMDSGAISQVAESVGDRAVVVIDEAYIEFSGRQSMATLIDRLHNVIVLRTLSKAYSLAGARLGVIVAHPSVSNYLRHLMPPYPLSQTAVAAAMRTTASENRSVVDDRIDSIVTQREWLADQLASLSFVRTVYRSDANFLLISVDDPTSLLAYCRANDVLLRDQSSQPHLEKCVRVSVGEELDMKRLIELFSVFESKR